MSVDVDWQTLTEGPDGAALAETIRDFVHERFQHIPLPRLIRSVKCHAFEFGTVAPQIVLKDICDPLPDFYETSQDDDTSAGGPGADSPSHIENTPDNAPDNNYDSARGVRNTDHARRGPKMELYGQGDGHGPSSQGAAPGILRGTSSLGYFHLPLSAGLPGTNTPLAAVAGARFQHGPRPAESQHHHAESFSSISPPPSETPPTPVTSRDRSSYFDQPHTSAVSEGSEGSGTETGSHGEQDHEVSPEDLQVVFQVTYSGDVKLSLTADVFLDYPMPSFVGIPLKLNITGMTFDGVGILSKIKRRAHLCFLAPEDAEALVGGDGMLDSPGDPPGAASTEKPSKPGALLEDIKIESEMGETDNGKQVLKNVGKIEKFILEQVRRIFEDEFVYPSFWTFLV